MSLHVEQASRDRRGQSVPRGALRGNARRGHAATSLEVLAGEIPDDLNGVYMRNGPNPQLRPERAATTGSTATAWCTPSTSPTARATYRNRWVRTDGLPRRARRGPRDLARHHGAVRRATPPDAPEKDTANTDVVFHRDRLLALWYRAGKPYALDPVTLETLGAEDFGGTLRCEVSAHAKVDERTGELMFFDYGVKPPYMRYGVVGPDGAVAPLRADRPAGPAPAARHGDHRAPLDPDGPAARRRPGGRARAGATSCTSSATCRRASA